MKVMVTKYNTAGILGISLQNFSDIVCVHWFSGFI